MNGGPGSGKTIFGMTFLWNGVGQFHEKGAYVSFSESKETMYENMRGLGMDLQKLEDRGMFWYQEVFAATEKRMGDVLTHVVETVATNQVKRVVIDSLSAVSQAFDQEYEARQIFHTVIEKLIRNLGCTTIVISERSAETVGHVPFEEFVADGIMGLKAGLPRELEVRKLRGTKLAKTKFVFTIDHGSPFSKRASLLRSTPRDGNPYPPRAA